MLKRIFYWGCGVAVLFVIVFALANLDGASSKPAIQDDNSHIALDLTTLRVPVAEAAEPRTEMWYFESQQTGTSGPWATRNFCNDIRSWRSKKPVWDNVTSCYSIKY